MEIWYVDNLVDINGDNRWFGMVKVGDLDNVGDLDDCSRLLIIISNWWWLKWIEVLIKVLKVLIEGDNSLVVILMICSYW